MKLSTSADAQAEQVLSEQRAAAEKAQDGLKAQQQALQAELNAATQVQCSDCSIMSCFVMAYVTYLGRFCSYTLHALANLYTCPCMQKIQQMSLHANLLWSHCRHTSSLRRTCRLPSTLLTRMLQSTRPSSASRLLSTRPEWRSWSTRYGLHVSKHMFECGRPVLLQTLYVLHLNHLSQFHYIVLNM